MRSLLLPLTGLLLLGCTVDLGNVFGAGASGGSGGAGATGGQGGAPGGQGGAGMGGGGSPGTGGALGGQGGTAGTGGSPGTGGATGGQGGSPGTGGMGQGGAMNGPTVPCGGMECQPGQVCCWNYQDENLDHCGAANTCGDGFLQINCNGPADCPNQVCCGEWNQQSGYQAVGCVNDCAFDVVLCGGDPSVCPFGQQCKQSQTLGDGFMVCVPG